MHRLMSHRRGHYLVALPALLALALVLLGGCDGDQTTADKQAALRDKGVDQIRAEQPVEPMTYSNTIDTINAWSRIWGQKGKVAYVYMKRADGSLDGYYVLKGLPVSYCVGGSPPYAYHDIPGDGDSVKEQVPAPGLDGAYYGSCDPNRYYGIDAVTGQYIEYTDGLILTALLSDQPLPNTEGVRPYVSSAEAAQKVDPAG